jgi:spermidine dehydrogenase
VSKSEEKELGLDSAITRRDFIYGGSLAVGGVVSGCATDRPPVDVQTEDYGFAVGDDWYGPGGSGDYAQSHGNTPGLVKDAHDIRAGRYSIRPRDAIDSGEQYDLVIVGGGISGLAAAHHFNRLNPSGRVLVLDNHPMFGGEAKRNDFVVNGVRISGPQGSNDTLLSSESGGPDDYDAALNIPRERQFAEPQGDAAGLRIPLEHFEHMTWTEHAFDVGHFFRGAANSWVRDVWGKGLDTTPWSDRVKEGFRRVRAAEVADVPGRDTDRWLDSLSMKTYYEEELGLPPEVTAFYDPIMASIIGLGCDGLSAYWGNYFGMPGFTRPEAYDDPQLHSFPGGNAAIARHFVKRLLPASIDGSGFRDIIYGRINFDKLDQSADSVRIRLNSTAVRVEHDGAPGNAERVVVFYVRDGRLHKTEAKSVVMACGGWVNRHIVRDLPARHRQAYDSLAHSPVLVANVALKNWRFLVRLGISAAIWTKGLGFTCNIRRPMIVDGESEPLHPDQPTVLTFYIPIYKPGLPWKQQGIAGRAEMLGTSFIDYERQIREQMTEMFSAGGFDPVNDIAGIVLNRWGHAYANPAPGFLFDGDDGPAPAKTLREPIGRIAIAHSELRGHQYWTGAAGEARRAVESLIDAYF